MTSAGTPPGSAALDCEIPNLQGVSLPGCIGTFPQIPVGSQSGTLNDVYRAVIETAAGATWYKLGLEYAPCSGGSCGGLGSSSNNLQFTKIVVQSPVANAFSNGSCSGSSESSCESVLGCNWSGGSQNRIVVCRDQNNNVVSDLFCPSPKPATSQSC